VQDLPLQHADLLDHRENKLGLVGNKVYGSESAIPDGLSLEITAVKLLLETLVAGQVCAGFGVKIDI
jgi:hypothetical protein